MEKYKLPKEFKEKWIAALRSGEYNQGKEALTRIIKFSEFDSYCCLGVACIVAKQDIDKKELNSGFIDTDYLKNITEIPNEIKGSQENKLVRVLVELNDGGYSFIQISDWLEDNTESY